jgi:hypothetical protein
MSFHVCPPSVDLKTTFATPGLLPFSFADYPPQEMTLKIPMLHRRQMEIEKEAKKQCCRFSWL